MKEIPSHVALICDFVNTVELDEEGSDKVATPEGLSSWLGRQGLAHASASRTDVMRARDLREALRVLLMVNNGLAVDTAPAQSVVEDVARRADVELRFDAAGTLVPEPTGTGVTAALGAIVAATSLAMQDGSWSRLKACRAETCHWAFFDQARNHSRAWCSMEVCGNRAKVRTYRRRRSGTPQK